jgi:hypothetical protein
VKDLSLLQSIKNGCGLTLSHIQWVPVALPEGREVSGLLSCTSIPPPNAFLKQLSSYMTYVEVNSKLVLNKTTFLTIATAANYSFNHRPLEDGSTACMYVNVSRRLY